MSGGILLHFYLLLTDFTTQMKSLDINTFFLPYFLKPNPAGILAADLRIETLKYDVIETSNMYLLQKGFADGLTRTVIFFFVFSLNFSRLSSQS